jgi:hypothetical protein
MRRWLAVVLAAVAIGASLGVSEAEAKTCRSGYTHAVIAGQQKCLPAGEFCSHGEASQYRRYHFKCLRVRGRYRLERS